MLKYGMLCTKISIHATDKKSKVKNSIAISK